MFMSRPGGSGSPILPCVFDGTPAGARTTTSNTSSHQPCCVHAVLLQSFRDGLVHLSLLKNNQPRSVDRVDYFEKVSYCLSSPLREWLA